MNAFLYSHSNFKIENYFSAFGKILVFANAFFYSNSNLKSIEKLIFSSFGKILVLVNAFLYSHSIFKKLKIYLQNIISVHIYKYLNLIQFNYLSAHTFFLTQQV